jgi:Ca2+-binding RTX toxin-like protein
MTSIVEYAALSQQSYDSTPAPVGSATVAFRMADTNFAAEAESAGFSATAYHSNGNIVIAYRGTDGAYLMDAITGWTTGAGFINQPQANLAIKFYQAVVAAYPEENIELTGHSLGGGLAGYVASIYGEKAVLFDNMAYEHASAAIVNLANPNSELFDPDIKEFIYGAADPWPIDESSITAYAEEGEILHANRLGQNIVATDVSIGDDVPLGPIDRHFLPSLVIALHGQTLSNNVAGGWEETAKYVFPHLIKNTEIANKAGFANATAMIRDVAYSTVGTADIGTVAATSIFDNLHDFSVAAQQGISLGQEIGGLNTVFSDAGDFITGYAALLARPESKNATLSEVISVADDHTLLAINLSDAIWQTEDGAATEEYLVGNLLDEVYDYQASSINSLLDKKFGNHALTNIGEVQIALGLDGFAGSVADHGSSLAVFIGTTSSDVIEGSQGQDIIFAANLPSVDGSPLSTDIIDGRGGDDILIGSSGDDHLLGGLGRDVLIGGGGADLLDGGTSLLFPGTTYETVLQDMAGDYLAGGLGDDTYQITASFNDYYGDGPFFDKTRIDQRTEAWYRLGLNYVDTISDSDGIGSISIHYDVADLTFDESFALDAFETFVNVSFDPRPNAFYNAYEWGGEGSGIWQVNTGPLTSVVYIDALNNDGGFSHYAILQAGYGNHTEGHSPLAAIELGDVTLVDGVSSSGQHLSAGTNAADILSGGDLDDQLFGAAGDDTLSAGSGDDYLDGGHGSDDLIGGDGSDIIFGRDGNDSLEGGDGSDILTGNGGIDIIHGGAGEDTVIIDELDVEFSGGSDYDVLVFASSASFIYDMSGGDFEAVVSGAGDDIISASGDGSQISLGEGNDKAYGGDGNDVINGGGGVDELHGGAGDDWIEIDHQDTIYTGDGGYDTLSYTGIESFTFTMESSGFEVLYSNVGDDVINGSHGDDVIQTFGGNDIVHAGAGNDTIDDGYDDDLIYGEDGNDTIYVGSGENTVDGGDGRDTVIFQSVMSELTITDGSDHVTVEGEIWGDTVDTTISNVEVIQFYDVALIKGTDDDDVLDGTVGSNIFLAGAGDDILVGHGNDDVFMYTSGDGSDIIFDDGGVNGGDDILRLTDLNQNDVTLTRVNADLQIEVIATGETISVANQFTSSIDPATGLPEFDNLGLEKIEFADGTSLNAAGIRANAVQVAPTRSDSFAANDSGGTHVLQSVPRSAEIISFPTSQIAINVDFSREVPSHAEAHTSSDGGHDTTGFTAQIIPLPESDYAAHPASDDLWFEPEPIGAVI